MITLKQKENNQEAERQMQLDGQNEKEDTEFGFVALLYIGTITTCVQQEQGNVWWLLCRSCLALCAFCVYVPVCEGCVCLLGSGANKHFTTL